MRVPLLASALLLGANLSPSPVHAAPRPAAASAPADDWFASVYTARGLEVRAEGRVFTLFALLNRAGYDAGPLRREHPAPAFRHGPARTRVREALATASPAVLAQAQAFFDAHPLPVDVYLARVLGGASAPGAARELDGLETLLERVEAEWPVASLRAETLPAYREAQRAWLPLLDVPLEQATRLLGLPEAKPPVGVVINLLEAEGSVRQVDTGQGWVLVVGPAASPDIEKVVQGYARLALTSRMGQRLETRWPGGAAALREARGMGVGEATVGEYGVALLSRALALRAVGAPPTAYEAAGREGYFGMKTLARSFEDPRPVDVWALEGLARVVPEQTPRK